jgi:hypothetical protein
MAGTATPIYPQTIKNWAVQILPADTTTIKTLVTGGTNGSVVEWLNVTSTDSANKDLLWYLNDGTTNYLISTQNTPLNAGNTNAVAAVASLNNTTLFSSVPFNNSGNKFIYVANGWSLRVSAGAAVTAARVINIVAHGGDY